MATYGGGDTLVFSYTPNHIPSQMDMYYVLEAAEIVRWNMRTIESGKMDGNTVTVNVPKDAPPLLYKITIYGYTESKVLSGTLTVNLREYMVTFSFDRESYKPGDTVKIHYKLIKIGTARDVKAPITINYGFDGGGYEVRTLRTTNLEGDITYTLPNNIADGKYLFFVEARGAAQVSLSFQTLEVRKGISGATVFGAAVIALLLLSLVMSFFALRRSGGGVVSRGGKKKYFYQPPREWEPPLEEDLQGESSPPEMQAKEEIIAEDK